MKIWVDYYIYKQYTTKPGPCTQFLGFYSLSGLTSYHKFSGSREAAGLELSNRSELWQAPRQQGCRDACQISERYNHHNIQSRSFEILWDLAVRRLTAMQRWGNGKQYCTSNIMRSILLLKPEISEQWVSNHRQLDRLLNSYFILMKKSNHRITGPLQAESIGHCWSLLTKRQSRRKCFYAYSYEYAQVHEGMLTHCRAIPHIVFLPLISIRYPNKALCYNPCDYLSMLGLNIIHKNIFS